MGDLNESTFVIAPEVQDSPSQAPLDADESGADGFAPLVDQRSDDYDDDDLGEAPALEDEPVGESGTILHEETDVDVTARMRAEGFTSGKKTIKVSRHGIEYPSLPPAVVKRIAQTFAKASGARGKITPDAMKAIMQATDWFFEQLGEDLEAYAKHAGRKTIDASDVLTLMKRYSTIYHWVSRALCCFVHTWLTSLQTTSDQSADYAIRTRAAPPSQGVAAGTPHAASYCSKKAAQGERRRGGRRRHLRLKGGGPSRNLPFNYYQCLFMRTRRATSDGGFLTTM